MGACRPSPAGMPISPQAKLLGSRRSKLTELVVPSKPSCSVAFKERQFSSWGYGCALLTEHRSQTFPWWAGDVSPSSVFP